MCKSKNNDIYLSVIWGVVAVLIIAIFLILMYLDGVDKRKHDLELQKAAMENGYIQQRVLDTNQLIWVKKDDR